MVAQESGFPAQSCSLSPATTRMHPIQYKMNPSRAPRSLNPLMLLPTHAWPRWASLTMTILCVTTAPRPSFRSLREFVEANSRHRRASSKPRRRRIVLVSGHACHVPHPPSQHTSLPPPPLEPHRCCLAMIAPLTNHQHHHCPRPTKPRPTPSCAASRAPPQHSSRSGPCPLGRVVHLASYPRTDRLARLVGVGASSSMRAAAIHAAPHHHPNESSLSTTTCSPAPHPPISSCCTSSKK